MRHRLSGQAGPTGGQAYTDVLGILECWDEQVLRVRRADATTVDIVTADVTRAKRIPPPPIRPRTGA